MHTEAKWAVGIVTAPRDGVSYLEQTTESLLAAGFADFTIFGEPGCDLTAYPKHTIRPVVYGDWTNWFCGLAETIYRNPEADYVAMFEDDVVVCKNSRRYLEESLPQLDEFATFSLYTPGIYHKQSARLFHNQQNGPETVSTLSVVFRMETALRFLADPMNVGHRSSGRNYFGKDISNTGKDIVIGLWAESLGLPIYFHTPSLAQHIGDVSTLPLEPNSRLKRYACSFPGDDFDATDLLDYPFHSLALTKITI
jgi:hypothetical protein